MYDFANAIQSTSPFCIRPDFNGTDASLPCYDGTTACVVQFGSSNINIATVILIRNGLVFAIQGAILLLFGSMSDYGGMKKYVLALSTLACWGSQFRFLGIKDASRYHSAIVVCVLSCKHPRDF